MKTHHRILTSLFMLFLLRQCHAHDGDLAEYLIDKAGIRKGICAIPACADGMLPVRVAQASGLLVHATDPSPEVVAEVRRISDEQGLLGTRVIVEKANERLLPYADNSIDLILIADFATDTLRDGAAQGILRVLRPRGKALLGCSARGETVAAAEMQKWLADAGIRDASVSAHDDYGLWAEIVKPVPEGIDAWSHWMHGVDNNPVSHDIVIRAPYLTQWMGTPYYMAMPVVSTAAGGRVFVASGHIAHHDREIPTLNLLCARNGYNGAVLWRRRLPEGYLVHRSAFIATDDMFYLLDGPGCLMLDPETGEEKGRFRIPGVDDEWKWMALKGRTLFVLAGTKDPPAETTLVRSGNDHWGWNALSKGYYEKPRIPWGFATTLAACDLDQKKARWVHKEPKPIDSRAVGLCDGKVFCYSPDSRIGCLDEKSGDLLWTAADAEALNLIEEPGKGLWSTPGFRTCCSLLCTPKALFFETQTRMNVVAVSAQDGRFLWKKKKTRNNPNFVFVDGQLVIAGIGPKGGTLAVEPMTGEELKDLNFQKVNCTRLTVCPDSFFCRGEGLGRYDRVRGEYTVDGSVRPGCNDGAIPANGLLYVGPWLCDCNLSLMGTVTLCSAGDFRFDHLAAEAERLEATDGDMARIEDLDVAELDWPTYRGNNARTAGSKASVPSSIATLWEVKPRAAIRPTPPVAAGGLIFVGGSDGVVRFIDAATGRLRWTFATAGPIRLPPSIWEGRAFVGAGDGYVYALEAATGRMLWRFRAAPVERRIMVYDSLCSTWPVNSGVLVADGVAYAAAGIIDRDGTYVYALDAKTGKIRWQNNETGHLDARLRKGVSVQGDLTIARGQLWMAGGNQVSPASYDLKSGQYIPSQTPTGRPGAPRGSEVAVFKDRYIVRGGRLMYSGEGRIVTPDQLGFLELGENGQRQGGEIPAFERSAIPPAWDEDSFAFLTERYGKLVCWDVNQIETLLHAKRQEMQEVFAKEKDWHKRRGMLLQLDNKMRGSGRWGPQDAEVLALAMAKNAVIVVCESRPQPEAGAQWEVRALSKQDGRPLWKAALESEPLLNGLAIDRRGRVAVALKSGGLICFGQKGG